MSLLKKRHQLPLFARLPMKFDIERIVKEFHEMQLDHFQKYTDLNPGGHIYEHALFYRQYLHKWFLSEGEAKRAIDRGESFYGEQYRQLGLTEYDSESYGRTDYERLKSEMDSGRLEIMKRVDKNSPNYIPEADERNFTRRTKYATGVFAEILDAFKGKVTRTRFAVAQPGFRTDTHIDANTDYTIRIHIPIITNVNSIFGIHGKKRSMEIHLPADGGVWFTNTGYPHYIHNRGTDPRVHLILAIAGQEDLPDIFDTDDVYWDH
jgi:hypothetical protein